MDHDAMKRAVAAAAVAQIEEGSILGVGTGSTVNHFIDLLAEAGLELRGAVSSSEASTRRMSEHGITILDLNQTGSLDVYVDGADEANRNLHLIKGGGGALTREKIVAAASHRFICIVDETKLVPVLGEFPLPIEVIPMARSYVARQLVGRFDGRPAWREGFVTDNGNHILDVHGLRIEDALSMERAMNDIAGVVTVGLFAVRPADLLLVAHADGSVRSMSA